MSDPDRFIHSYHLDRGAFATPRDVHEELREARNWLNVAIKVNDGTALAAAFVVERRNAVYRLEQEIAAAEARP